MEREEEVEHVVEHGKFFLGEKRQRGGGGGGGRVISDITALLKNS